MIVRNLQAGFSTVQLTLRSAVPAILVSYASVVVIDLLFAFCGYAIEPFSIKEPQQHRSDDSPTVYRVAY